MTGFLPGRTFAASDVLVWHQQSPLVTLPVLCTTCRVCEVQAEPGANGVIVSRIGGDGANGYEAFHQDCLD